ncbi:hypothetical protein PRIPAC_72167 [Pristionchus pacificus]|uniref:Uncharacterized protein n=1 Tax=Pristionchus pacificus TaxID=54126 RepID=A0A2A6C6L8_PRIPA|nr:hypothetical protein PRIPAC_72167 [Pristionchus pacificus]|eukprot:PDM73760.1 hypothetical protein PRIPAC_41116 [Pristionchus pacificus]
MLRHLPTLITRSRSLFAKSNEPFRVASRRAVSDQKMSSSSQKPLEVAEKTPSSSSPAPSRAGWKLITGLFLANCVGCYWLGRSGLPGEEKSIADLAKPVPPPAEPVDAAAQFFKERKTRPLAIYEGSGRVRTYLPHAAGTEEFRKICDELKQAGIHVEYSDTDRAAYDFYYALDRPLLADSAAFDRLHAGVKRIIDLEKSSTGNQTMVMLPYHPAS